MKLILILTFLSLTIIVLICYLLDTESKLRQANLRLLEYSDMKKKYMDMKEELNKSHIEAQFYKNDYKRIKHKNLELIDECTRLGKSNDILQETISELRIAHERNAHRSE